MNAIDVVVLQDLQHHVRLPLPDLRVAQVEPFDTRPQRVCGSPEWLLLEYPGGCPVGSVHEPGVDLDAAFVAFVDQIAQRVKAGSDAFVPGDQVTLVEGGCPPVEHKRVESVEIRCPCAVQQNGRGRGVGARCAVQPRAPQREFTFRLCGRGVRQEQQAQDECADGNGPVVCECHTGFYSARSPSSHSGPGDRQANGGDSNSTLTTGARASGGSSGRPRMR